VRFKVMQADTRVTRLRRTRDGSTDVNSFQQIAYGIRPTICITLNHTQIKSILPTGVAHYAGERRRFEQSYNAQPGDHGSRLIVETTSARTRTINRNCNRARQLQPVTGRTRSG